MFKLSRIQEERSERHKYKNVLKDRTVGAEPVMDIPDIGSYDTGDPNTTNLYLGNLNPKVLLLYNTRSFFKLRTKNKFLYQRMIRKTKTIDNLVAESDLFQNLLNLELIELILFIQNNLQETVKQLTPVQSWAAH